jgi:REP element-mobilizing transposase RayT
MRTYTQILYHIVFGTKYREAVLVKENRRALFNYIYGILKKKKCYLYRVNGVESHIHLALDLHPYYCTGRLGQRHQISE